MGIHKLIRFHATNQEEKKEIESFFPGSRTIVANNLPDMKQPPLQFCEKQTGTLNCVFIARIVPIKNLLFLLSVLEKVKTAVNLTIIGPKENEQYWNSCEETIKQLPGNIKVNMKGDVRKDLLNGILIQNHLFVLPTTGENFGHSIFESFLSGRPVLISDQTPWRNLAQKQVGWDLSLSDQQAFVNAIETAAGWNQQEFETFSRNSWEFAHNFITDPRLVEEYKVLFS